MWKPGFYAGEVTAELSHAGDAAGFVWLLDVSPDPNKLGRDTFKEMVDELWREDPELVVGTEPANRSIGSLDELETPWIEFSRLRLHGPQFIRSLGPIRSLPRRQLVARRELVPLQRARRVDERTARSAGRSQHLAAALAGDLGEAPRPTERVDVPVTYETLDSSANRALLFLTKALLRRCRSLRDRLKIEVAKDSEGEARTPLGTRWPARRAFLDRLERDLDSAMRRDPLRSVTRPENSAAGLTAIAADPSYARTWGCGWRALRPGVEGAPTSERLWISPTWEIFERWCYVNICRAVRDAERGLKWQRLQSGHRWVGTSSERSVSIELQPTFRAGPDHADGRWSVSRQREPDIVVTIEDAQGTRFVALDAKYRTSRENVLDAMSTAHVYRDSLRLQLHQPECALLLVPAGGGVPWLEDPLFQREHRVGVSVLRPHEPIKLPGLVSKVLSAQLLTE
jgi:hypothetical protein